MLVFKNASCMGASLIVKIVSLQGTTEKVGNCCVGSEKSTLDAPWNCPGGFCYH